MKKVNYRLLFWLSIFLLLGTWGYIVYDKNKSIEKLDVNSTQVVTFQKDSVRDYIDELTVRLDSVQSKNGQYEKKLRISPLFDTTNATPEQRRLARLLDSTGRVKDSINDVLDYMNRMDVDSLSKKEYADWGVALNQLSNIWMKMDFTIDRLRLSLLKADTDKLGATVARFNGRTDRLKRLSERLASVTNVIAKAVAVLTRAINNGIIVARTAA